MPLYLCSTPADDLTREMRQRIATAITDVHCEATGAPRKFVHVVFFASAQAAMFDLLTPNGAPNGRCQLYGSIRSGRTDDIKERLVSGLRHAAAEILGFDRDDVVMSTRDVDAKWVMEGGELLPEPGEEAAWLKRHSG
ncbi:MAG: tautomerase family protein [Pseudomonadota bacterium]